MLYITHETMRDERHIYIAFSRLTKSSHVEKPKFEDIVKAPFCTAVTIKNDKETATIFTDKVSTGAELIRYLEEEFSEPDHENTQALYRILNSATMEVKIKIKGHHSKTETWTRTTKRTAK